MTHALSLVSMGVEARCCPSKSTEHCRHMKRHPFLCNGCPCHGHPHCHCRCHLCCRHQHRCRHRPRRNRPLPLHYHQTLLLQSPLTVAATISVALPSAIAVVIAHAVSHCHLCHGRPLQLQLPSAVTIAMPLAISESCCLGTAKNCIQPIEAKNAYIILFCSDSGRCIDQSQMTDQVSSGDGQHQRWVASSKYLANS
jgi:hypothetical protein